MATDTLVLWGRPSSSNTQKALWALSETGCDFELRHASAWLGPGMNFYKPDKENPNPTPAVNTPAFHKMNPNHTVPVLEVAGVPGGAIYESHTVRGWQALFRACLPCCLHSKAWPPWREGMVSSDRQDLNRATFVVRCPTRFRAGPTALS